MRSSGRGCREYKRESRESRTAPKTRKRPRVGQRQARPSPRHRGRPFVATASRREPVRPSRVCHGGGTKNSSPAGEGGREGAGEATR
ncbi:hypothetical protein LX36DRAFT_749067, partial [Colletotrichum falcatum]